MRTQPIDGFARAGLQVFGVQVVQQQQAAHPRVGGEPWQQRVRRLAAGFPDDVEQVRQAQAVQANHHPQQFLGGVAGGWIFQPVERAQQFLQARHLLVEFLLTGAAHGVDSGSSSV